LLTYFRQAGEGKGGEEVLALFMAVNQPAAFFDTGAGANYWFICEVKDSVILAGDFVSI
jgi:hypothetical protein